VKEAQDEVADTFKNINGDPAVKINLLLKQLSLMRGRERELKFIPSERVKDIYDRLTKLIKSEFDRVRN
jgi:hypothetical protein